MKLEKLFVKTKGKEVVINKDGKVKQIPIEQLDGFLLDGWSRGRGKPAWNKGLNKYSDPRVKKYSDSCANRKIDDATRMKISQKLKGRKVPKEVIEKRVRTIKEKGRHLSEETKQKISKSLMGHKVSQEQIQKRNNTMLERYGVTSIPGKLTEEGRRKLSLHNSSEEFQKYQRELKIKNGTINTSKPEKESFDKLKTLFGENDVFTYYYDERYPFECDAYIKSLDLFIEFNYHWSHGGHPFDPNNEKDIEKLNKYISKKGYYISNSGRKKKNFYYVAIDVWTKRDVKKLQCFKNNKLNYLIFYNTKEFNAWFEHQATMIGKTIVERKK